MSHFCFLRHVSRGRGSNSATVEVRTDGPCQVPQPILPVKQQSKILFHHPTPHRTNGDWSKTQMNESNHDALILAAVAARKNAYATYSEFSVGAALLAADGRIFTGCNVENVSYGLAMCAERVAIGNAVAHGCQSFEAIAIATEGAVSPCGACLQVLAEFCQQLDVLMTDENGQNVRRTTLQALLPDRFAG